MTPKRTATTAILLALVLSLAPTTATATPGDYFTVDHPDELTVTRPERICANKSAVGQEMAYEWFADRPPETPPNNTRDLDSEDCAWFGQDRPEGHNWLLLSYDDSGTTRNATFYFSANGTLTDTHQAGTVDILDGYTDTLIFVTLTILSFFHGWLIAGTFAFAAGIGTLVTDPTYLTVTLGFGGVLIGTLVEVLGHKWKPIKRAREWVRES